MKRKYSQYYYFNIQFAPVFALISFVCFGMLVYIFAGDDVFFETELQGIIVLISPIVYLVVIWFYWLFSTVEFSHKGIDIKFCDKTIRHIDFNQITSIECDWFARNPIFKISIAGKKNLKLDRRKKIKDALIYYGDDRVKELIENHPTGIFS